jgi:hypothetical protein
MGIAAYGRGLTMASGLVTRENKGRFIKHKLNDVPDIGDGTGVVLYKEINSSSGILPEDMVFVVGNKKETKLHGAPAECLCLLSR